ncbi:MAG: phosphatase PAP2 family protein [Clostridiales bacterium]|nr:phosphatase PAP2 family protein [Clostridiales bacterium]
MAWELEFIKLLQRGSNTFCDYLFYIITQLGTELMFMFAVMVLYWCIDKREGFRLINLFAVSQLVVGFVKVVVNRPRPYTIDGIRPILEETSGYSFPSGHSNNIAVVCTHLSLQTKNKNAKTFRVVVLLSAIIILGVMFSRVYLGQHYPTDVLAGAAIGIGVGLVGFILFGKILGEREEKLVYLILPGCVLLLILGIVFFIVKGDGFDTLISLAGTYSAASIGYYIEKKHIKYDIKSDKLWHYFVRFIVGAVIVTILEVGGDALLNHFAGEIWSLIVGFIIYFMIGIFVTLLAPMLYKRLKI